MRKSISILKYTGLLYMKTNKMVLPAVVWFAFQFFAYTIIPVDVVSSVIMSAMVLFFIMVWLTFAYYDTESRTAEMIALLRVRNESFYYSMKIVFLFLIGVVFTLIGIGVPLLQHVISGFALYRRAITFYDIGCSIALHLVFAFLGIALAGIFQERLVGNRKSGILYMLVIVVYSLVKDGAAEQIVILKYVNWILPPVDRLAYKFSQAEFFPGTEVITAVMHVAGYSMVLIVLQVWLRKRKNFE